MEPTSWNGCNERIGPLKVFNTVPNTREHSPRVPRTAAGQAAANASKRESVKIITFGKMRSGRGTAHGAPRRCPAQLPAAATCSRCCARGRPLATCGRRAPETRVSPRLPASPLRPKSPARGESVCSVCVRGNSRADLWRGRRQAHVRHEPGQSRGRHAETDRGDQRDARA